MPVINGDSAFTMIVDTMLRPHGAIAGTLEERAQWTDEILRAAFARSELVGWHYCGLNNATNLIARKKARQHSGLLDSCGEPYPELQKTLEGAANGLYEIGTGKV